MKMKKSWVGLLSLIAIAAVGCASATGTVSEESLGLRKTNLYTEDNTKPDEGKFTAVEPGKAKTFDRAFENAPPMIPHSVKGLLPITKANNACLGCHMPEVAAGVKATPVPPTHFTDFRPQTVMKGTEVIKEGRVLGKDIGNTSDIKLAKAKKLHTLYQGRYNCTQCHAPQAQIAPIVKNTFQPDFRKSSERKRSNLLDVMNEGVE